MNFTPSIRRKTYQHTIKSITHKITQPNVHTEIFKYTEDVNKLKENTRKREIPNTSVKSINDKEDDMSRKARMEMKKKT